MKNMNLHLLLTGRKARWLEGGAAAVLIVLAMLWQTGAFMRGKIHPGLRASAQANTVAPALTLRLVELPEVYQAVGTVRSRTQVELSPRLVARILELPVRAGDRVARGDVLMRLDDAELSAAVRQAAEHNRQAQAARDLAATDLERTRQLLASGGVSQQAFDQADSRARQARAAAEATAQAQQQAEAVLGYATIVSPMDGIVGERLADPGDLASPGQIVMRLFDPTRLMLEVPVREGLVSRIRLGEQVPFHVDALDTNLTGDVREVVPAVDPGSRTFLIKVCIGTVPGLMPGMSGTLALTLGTRTGLVVPETCITHAGQLEYVQAVLNGQDRPRLIRTIPASRGLREVVSGLETGMLIRVTP